MKKNILPAVSLMITGICACAVYFWVARILQLDYQTKSLIKMLLFLGLPFASWIVLRNKPWREIVQWLLPRRDQYRRLARAIIAGILIIVAANLLIDPLCRIFGISGIIDEIQTRTHTTRRQLLLALLYIPLVNALAEELFFRGFCFLELADRGYRKLAFVFSAALFSFYHLSIFQNWFSPATLALALGSLFLCGLLLNRIVHRDRHIVGAWLLHGLVNIAIISISLKFFT